MICEHPSPRVRRTDERAPEVMHFVSCPNCWLDWTVVGRCNFPELSPDHAADADGYSVLLRDPDVGGVVEFPDGASSDIDWHIAHGDEASVLYVDLPETIPLKTRARLADELVESTGADTRSCFRDEW